MKGKILVPLMLLMSLALVGMVMGADSITITAVTYATGTQRFIATPSVDTSYANCSQIDWFIYNSTGVMWNATNTSIGDSFNGTKPGNITVSTSNLSDTLGVSGYTINATCWNASNHILLATDTETFGSDNTVPICTQTSLADNTQYNLDETTSITVTCTNSSSATVTFDGNSYTMTESEDVCTLTISDIPPTGYNKYTATTSDGYNSTACTSVTGVNFIKPSIQGGGKKIVIPNTGDIVVGDKVFAGTSKIKSFFDFIMSLLSFDWVK